MRQKEEEEERHAAAAEVSTAEVATPPAFVPQDLPAAHISIDIPPPALQDTGLVSVLRSVESSPDSFVDVHISATSSPTLSISTISDLTPTELDDDIGEGGGAQTNIHHDTFYFEDGNVEIVCGNTVFRVHSTIISFASPKLRDIFSRMPHAHTQMSGRYPRVIFDDSVEDFSVLLKLIYTPG